MKVDYIAEQGQENCLWYWSHKANQVSCPLWTLHSIYQAQVQPHFNFCNIFQGNCGVTLQDKLQKLQNRPPRVLTRSNYNADVKNLFEFLGWKTLVSQRQTVRATMVFKSLQGLGPENVCSKFVHRDSGYCLRDSNRLMFCNRAQTNTKTALAIMAQCCGTVCHQN